MRGYRSKSVNNYKRRPNVWKRCWPIISAEWLSLEGTETDQSEPLSAEKETELRETKYSFNNALKEEHDYRWGSSLERAIAWELSRRKAENGPQLITSAAWMLSDEIDRATESLECRRKELPMIQVETHRSEVAPKKCFKKEKGSKMQGLEIKRRSRIDILLKEKKTIRAEKRRWRRWQII